MKDKWRTKGTTTDDDLLAGPVGLGLVLTRRQRLRWDSLDTNCSVSLENNLLHLGVADEVEVLVVGAGAVDIAVCGVRAATGVTEPR